MGCGITELSLLIVLVIVQQRVMLAIALPTMLIAPAWKLMHAKTIVAGLDAFDEIPPLLNL